MTDQANIDPALEQLLQAADKSGLHIAPYPQHLKLRKGIPVSSIAFQWLINSSRWPIDRVTRFVGPSAELFSYQLANWFLQVDGYAVLLNPRLELNQANLVALGTLDPALQNHLLIDQSDTAMHQPEKLHRLVDNLTFKNEITLLISSNGFETINTVLSAFRTNMTLHLSNEYTIVACEPNSIVTLDLRSELGGTSAYNFSQKKTPDCGKSGQIITISNPCPHTGARKISVPVLSSLIRDTAGKNNLCTYFDWGAADAHFLTHQYGKIANAIALECKYVRGTGLHCKCPQFGIVDFISASEFGQALQQNHDAIDLLQNELGIQTL